MAHQAIATATQTKAHHPVDDLTPPEELQRVVTSS